MARTKKVTKYPIPEYMLPFLINGINEGYDESEIKAVLSWMNEYSICSVHLPRESEYKPYFSEKPIFGNANYVVDCECISFGETEFNTFFNI